MLDWNPANYGPSIQSLLASEPQPALGPSQPDRHAEPLLRRLDAQSMFSGRPIVDSTMAECCRAALWLAFNFLDASHTISQSVENREGSYWHGIMHRREPDFANAKYWFRKVGRHPVFDDLMLAARELATAETEPSGAGTAERAMAQHSISERGSVDRAALPPDVRRVVAGNVWDAMAFVDLCELASERGGAPEAWCRCVAQREWRLLFDYCFRRAVNRQAE